MAQCTEMKSSYASCMWAILAPIFFHYLKKLIHDLVDFLLRPRLIQVLLTVYCATYFLWRERNKMTLNSKCRCVSALCSLIKMTVDSKVSSWKFGFCKTQVSIGVVSPSL
ncbi:hypothetical protein KFK09_017500 [Dendrobium nobile]|uniref:Uncharacterized protein n=1 Tax=Dendrobium nobile TaxID=94219 RepID=A0A8T3B2E5_DENNO|nr:hypothetical protein KFK09_017500 [Dendrobium nobile]